MGVLLGIRPQQLSVVIKRRARMYANKMWGGGVRGGTGSPHQISVRRACTRARIAALRKAQVFVRLSRIVKPLRCRPLWQNRAWILIARLLVETARKVQGKAR